MKTILLLVSMLLCVTNSCKTIKVITFNGSDKEVYVKSNCYHPIGDKDRKIVMCKTYHEPKEHEILAGNIGPAPSFLKLCLQDEDPVIHEALTEAWNNHILLEEAISNKKTEIANTIKEKKLAEKKLQEQLARDEDRRRRVESAHKHYNQMIEFAKEHHIDF